MDFCTSSLPPKVTAITEVVGMSAKSKTAWKLSIATPHWQNSQKPFSYISLGNAATERLFSHIGLNKTKHRNRLGISTLNSL